MPDTQRFWSVTHPSLETISCILQCIIKYVRKESYGHWRTIFFDTGKLVEREKKWHDPSQYETTSSSQILAVMTQAQKTGRNSNKVNWNANNEKKWHELELEGRTERAGGTRCPFDRSLHSSSLYTPLVSMRKTKGVKEKEREEREGNNKEGLDLRANITYIPRHVRFVHVELF